MLLAGTCLSAATAQAQDATWLLNPGSNDWNTGTNWSSVAVPTGTATFGQSNVTSIFFSPGLTTVGTLTFNANAPAYNFNVIGCACDEFRITEAGIVNNSSNAPTFDVLGGTLSFRGGSTAGNADITNRLGGVTEFRDGSSAGTATITNRALSGTDFHNSTSAANAIITNNGGTTNFFDASTAGSAIITNWNGGGTFFGTPGGIDTSSAGNADITNRAGAGTGFAAFTNAGSATITNNGGQTLFVDNSTAQNATITNRNGGTTQFYDFSTAGNAVITNNIAGATVFNDQTTAGNATIINNSGFPFGLIFADQSTGGNATIITNAGGSALFFFNSTGGNARFITAAGGVVDFSGSAGDVNGVVSAGSIEGAGTYVIGGTQFVVGSNNLSTEVSGLITECGCAPMFVKVGAGTLTFAASGIYNYTGPTVVAGGALIVNGDLTSSSSVTALPGGTIGGTGLLPDTFIDGGTLSPGNSIGTINIAGNLTFSPAGTYLVEVDRTTSDLTNVAGTATLAGTVQVSSPTGAYKFGSPYTILSATGGLLGQFNAVTGTFVTGTVNNVGNDVLLTLQSNLSGFGGNNINRQNAAAALDRGFNAAGNNAGFEALFLLPPGSLPNALTQLSGELGTAAGPANLLATDQFLKLMLDPFAGTRGDASGGPALGFAPGEARVQGDGKRLRGLSVDPEGATGPAGGALDQLGGGIWQQQQYPWRPRGRQP